jgi:hypothetical protein
VRLIVEQQQLGRLRAGELGHLLRVLQLLQLVAQHHDEVGATAAECRRLRARLTRLRHRDSVRDRRAPTKITLHVVSKPPQKGTLAWKVWSHYDQLPATSPRS